MPIVRKHHESAGVRIRHCLLVAEPEQDVLAAAGTTANQTGTLPPGGELLVVQRRVVVLELKVNACQLIAGASPRASDVNTMID